MHIHSHECAHVQYRAQCESELRVYEPFNLAASPAVYSLAIHVRSLSKVKSMSDVESSSALLMLVSSLSGFIMPSKQTARPDRKQDTAHIIWCSYPFKTLISVVDYLTFHVEALLALWQPGVLCFVL